MRSLPLLALACPLLLACASTTPSGEVVGSGWLKDCPPLESDRPGALYWWAPEARLAGYRALTLAPVETFPPEADAEAVAARERFAVHLAEVLRLRLGERFELVDAAGPGVLRLRYAVTEAERAAIASGHAFHRGRASVEAELLDAASGERLAVVIARRLGAETTRLQPGKPEDGAAIAEEWAKNLCQRLSERGLPARAATGSGR
jgi:hypothetical protein